MVRKNLKGGNQFNQTLTGGDTGGGALDQANKQQAVNAAQTSEMSGQGGGAVSELMPAPGMPSRGISTLQDSANTSQQGAANSVGDTKVGIPTSCQKGLAGGIFGGRKTFRKKRKKRRTKKKSKRKGKKKSKRKGKKKKGGRTRRRKMKKLRFSRMPPLKV